MDSPIGPIGVFDSGLGGLTVLKQLRSHLPGHDFIYLGDTARLPYGAKSPQTIQLYLKQNIDYLKQYDVSQIVVACNSASTVLEPESFSIPTIGVIQPGAIAALGKSLTKNIAVLGTRATIQSGAYKKYLLQLNPHVQVHQVACPLFVPLVEEGLEIDPLTNLISYRYLNHLNELNVDTVILGCTHYPRLHLAIRKVLGQTVHLIDSAYVIAEDLLQRLGPGPKQKGKTTILCTDTTEQFQAMIPRILSNAEQFEVIRVDL